MMIKQRTILILLALVAGFLVWRAWKRHEQLKASDPNAVNKALAGLVSDMTFGLLGTPMAVPSPVQTS